MEKSKEKFSAALTAEEIHNLDIIRSDNKANENSLLVALNYFSNRSSELELAKKTWWVDLAKKHGLDLSTKKYTTTQGGIEVKIVEE